MTPLWTSDAIAAAMGGVASARFDATGVTFDSREVAPGHLFVAMAGEAMDGHDFVSGALAAGAAGARGGAASSLPPPSAALATSSTAAPRACATPPTPTSRW